MAERSNDELASLELELAEVNRLIGHLSALTQPQRARSRLAWLQERAATIRAEIAGGS